MDREYHRKLDHHYQCHRRDWQRSRELFRRCQFGHDVAAAIFGIVAADLLQGDHIGAAHGFGAVLAALALGLAAWADLAVAGFVAAYLGLNAVRGICVQYMLDESFKSDSPEIQKIFDGIWKASALASDLCFRLGQKLRLPDPGVLSTHVVLSYVGHLAAAALLPKDVAVATAEAGLLERAQAEQQHLGVAACELARLLMQSWELPSELIERVSAIDSVLVSPSHVADTPLQAEQTGLSYLSARAGEWLAQGRLNLPSDITDLNILGQDGFYLGSYMHLPHLQHGLKALQAPELNVAVERMLQALRGEAAGQPT